jgi:branched-chain amino acid aminotransferase
VIGAREIGAPSVASINFHLGTGVFDGIMAYWNRDHYYLHHGEEHFSRFRVGSSRLGLDVRWSVDQLIKAVQELLALEPAGTQYVRPIAYRRAPELWVTGNAGKPVDVTIFTVRTTRDVDELISCHVSPVERISARCIPRQTKVSGAYVNSFLARRTAEAAGFADGLMLDREGRLTEASAANVFLIRDECLLTPPLNPDVFPGITRGVVLKLARRVGIECHERDVRVGDLRSLDGGFLCSTLMEIRGISRLDNRELGTEENSVFEAIVAAFRRYTRELIS